MTSPVSVALREVKPSDLQIFYAQQLDPEAIRMAAFVGDDPTDQGAFTAHWAKILAAAQNINRTIMAEGRVAGYIACYPQAERREVTYWLGREFWDRGIATRALEIMLQLVMARPIFARIAADNLGSLRVLQKCGFQIVGKHHGFARGRGEDTEEYILRLDLDCGGPSSPSGGEAVRRNARQKETLPHEH